MRQKIVKTVLFLLVLPYALALVYPFMRPPSTLMIADFLSLRIPERTWVPLSRISHAVNATVIVSEDGAFCEHYGFDFNQIEKSIEKSEKTNRPLRGASTITQQLARNLFLWQGRSWTRKLLEVPLTAWLELTWRKTWILEAYLNVAEWGDGIYGIEAAARHYYGIHASQLSYYQASLLATMLPNPHERSATHPGPAQAAMASQLLWRATHATPDLSCIRQQR